MAAQSELVPSAGGTSGLAFTAGETLPFAIDAAGAWLAVATSSSGFDLVDLARNARTARIQHGVGAISAIAFDASSRIVALAQGRQIVRLWDRTRGEVLAALETNGSAISRLAFEREGRSLAAASDRGEVFVWDLRTFALRARWRASGGGLMALDFGSQGTRLVTLDADGHLALWDALAGELLLESRSPERAFVSAAFVDDTSIACLESTSGRLWMLDPSRERCAAAARGLRARARAERRFASALGDPEVSLLDPAAGTSADPALQGLIEERHELVARAWIGLARQIVEADTSSARDFERVQRLLDAAERLADDRVRSDLAQLRRALANARERR